MTLRNRISGAAAVGVLIVVASVSSVLYLSYAASVRSRVDATLVDAAQQAAKVAERLKQSAIGNGSGVDLSRPIPVGSTSVQLLPGPVSVGEPTRFGRLDTRDVAVAAHSQPAYFTDAQEHGRRFRVYTAAAADLADGSLVQTSRAADADAGALRNAALLLSALTLAAAGLTYCLARVTAGRVLRPIADLTAAAEHITRTRDLSARLGGAGSKDEVGRLRASFDAMLAALHESVTAQQQLVADASHELRTPLTSLTTNLDLLEDGAGLADPQAPALVRAARDEAGELNELVADLLELARYTESAPHREATRLDLLAADVVRRRRERSPHALLVTDLLPCLGYVDPAAVHRAVTNLVENAVKWSPPGAAVRVAVAGGRIAVADDGPGIADTDVPHIFERFYRAPAARGTPGAGLGLAIVGQVARANGGTVQVRTDAAGSTFTLAFPEMQFCEKPGELVEHERSGDGTVSRHAMPEHRSLDGRVEQLER
ncbi:MAG TPA: HAMP domain-containing sensor histidine kinase [Jatrophihabitans sp.]|nr:HAMP domain-containing sensor histidine kinase [Jatrophihabitans sp.]